MREQIVRGVGVWPRGCRRHKLSDPAPLAIAGLAQIAEETLLQRSCPRGGSMTQFVENVRSLIVAEPGLGQPLELIDGTVAVGPLGHPASTAASVGFNQFDFASGCRLELRRCVLLLLAPGQPTVTRTSRRTTQKQTEKVFT
jgi:hypothetical protein